MEESSTTNYPQQAKSSESEFIVKEEILDTFNDGVEDPMKCGEVLLFRTEQIVLKCGFCDESYADMNEFGTHIQEKHIGKKQTIENFDVIRKQETTQSEDGDEQIQPQSQDCKESISHDETFCSNLKITVKIDDTLEENLNNKTKIQKRPLNRKTSKPSGKDTTLYCNICKIQFKFKACFLKHNEKNHNLLRPCQFCKKTFASLDERSEHEKTHVGDSPYTCSQCPIMFKNGYCRDKHVENVHEGIKPHKCLMCDRSFATRTLLQAHLVVHSLPGQHSCEICGRQFAHESRKKMHMRMHTGERSYQCEECGNRYMNQAMLTDHKKKHTGVKDVECKTCGKLFYTKRRMRHHAIIHSSVKRHSCPTCGDSFKKGDALKQHMKLHSNIKEYLCNICGKEFAQAAGLYSHKKSHLKDAAE